jgi:hypothetical protein
MMTIFFPGRKSIVLDILPKDSKFNQLYFADYISPDLKRATVNFHGQIPEATFWVHRNNAIWRHGSKMASKCEKHHVS